MWRKQATPVSTGPIWTEGRRREAFRGFVAFGTLVACGLLLCAPAVAQDGIARAVLFFSPTCPHCRVVVEDHLPGFFRDTGGMPSMSTDVSVPESERSVFLLRNERLEILLVDASRPIGHELFAASTISQHVPMERQGVPRLVVGDNVLVGSLEIPERFPQLVSLAIQAGGTSWPEIGAGALSGYPPETQARNAAESVSSDPQTAPVAARDAKPEAGRPSTLR